MKLFEYRFHKLFFMPNPTTYGLNARKIQEAWLYYGIASTIIIILLFAWYYWFTRPDLKALKRFWTTFFLGLLITPMWAAVPLFHTNPQKHINKFMIFINAWSISLINVFLIYFLVIIIFMVLSQFSCGNLKAMRKYPFSWIP